MDTTGDLTDPEEPIGYIIVQGANGKPLPTGYRGAKLYSRLGTARMVRTGYADRLFSGDLRIFAVCLSGCTELTD